MGGKRGASVRFRAGGSVFIALLILGLCSAGTVYGWHGYVVKVYDGDSLRVKKGNGFVEVRLYGIDAPEHGQPYADRARRFARSRLLKKTVTIEPRDVDRYGRVVALVKSQGSLVNRELVARGLAWVYPRYCLEQPLCGEMRKDQDKARRRRWGLWKEDRPVSPWQWKREHRSERRRNREYFLPYWR